MGYDTYYSAHLRLTTTDSEGSIVPFAAKLNSSEMYEFPPQSFAFGLFIQEVVNDYWEIQPPSESETDWILTINEDENRAYEWRTELETICAKAKEIGVFINGNIDWDGEEQWDNGTAVVRANQVIFMGNVPAYNLLKELEDHLESEYREHLAYAKERNWAGIGFESVEEYMEDVEIFSDDESTLWERWYRYGVQAAIDILKRASISE